MLQKLIFFSPKSFLIRDTKKLKRKDYVGKKPLYAKVILSTPKHTVWSWVHEQFKEEMQRTERRESSRERERIVCEKREANDLNLKWKLLCSLAMERYIHLTYTYNLPFMVVPVTSSKLSFLFLAIQLHWYFSIEKPSVLPCNKKIYRLWIFNDFSSLFGSAFRSFVPIEGGEPLSFIEFLFRAMSLELPFMAFRKSLLRSANSAISCLRLTRFKFEGEQFNDR